MKEYYEAFWSDLDDDPVPWDWERRRALLLREAREGERVLDLGCGSGRFLAALQGHGCDPVGVDISDRALERAGRVAPGAELRRLEADGSLPLPTRSVDLVWCSEVMEHVGDVGGLLNDVRRVLRPGGRLLITTPHHGRLQGALIALSRFDTHFDPLGQHLRFFTRTSLRRALESTGFEQITVRATGGMPPLRSSLVARAVRSQPPSPASSVRRASSTSEAERGACGSR